MAAVGNNPIQRDPSQGAQETGIFSLIEKVAYVSLYTFCSIASLTATHLFPLNYVASIGFAICAIASTQEPIRIQFGLYIPYNNFHYVPNAVQIVAPLAAGMRARVG